jgi:hypothetical protein
VIDVGYDRHQIMEAVMTHLQNGRFPKDCLYGNGRTGKRIAELQAEVELTVEKRLAY